MSKQLQNIIFELELQRRLTKKRAKKARIEKERAEKELRKELQNGNKDIARMTAAKVVRKNQEYVSSTELEHRLDTMVSEIKTASTTQQVASDVQRITAALTKINQKNLGTEKVNQIMENFKIQTDDVNILTKSLESSMSETPSGMSNVDAEEKLMQEYTDQLGAERALEMPSAKRISNKDDKKEQALDENLRRLRV